MKDRYYQSEWRKKAGIPGNDRDRVLDNHCETIARDACIEINRFAGSVGSSLVAGQYRAQYMLERLIQMLQERV